MKPERCENMHLYPTDRYSECPFCSGLINENNMRLMLDGKFVNKKKVSLKKDENGVYIRPTEEKKKSEEAEYSFFSADFWNYVPRVCMVIIILLFYIPVCLDIGSSFLPTMFVAVLILLFLFVK